MKKLMVAIAAAAISLAGVAGTWFEAGFGESAASTGGAWLTDGDVTAPTFEGETLVLEDAEAPVVFAADEAKTPADGDIEVSTVLSFQGFQELPEIDPDAKAGVCALEGGNFWVVGYDAVGATNQWFDTGIAAVIGESVNVGVTVTNAVAGYQIGDSTLFEVPTRAEEIREVCYLGNGSVTALGADYTDKFVQIVLPEIEGLVATSDVTRAEVGATVEVWFVDGEKISSDPETKFTYTVGDDGVLTLDPAGQELPTAMDAAAKIGTVLYLTLQDAINASQADDTVTLLADIALDSELALGKNLVLDFGGFTVTAAANGDKDAIWVKSVAAVTLTNGKLVDNNTNCAIYNSGDLTIAEDFEIVANAGSGILSIAGSGSETRAKLAVNGKITALANKGGDPNGTKNGICGHGNDTTVGTDIIIGEGAEIEASGNGVYFPCAGTLTVNDGAVKGWENGIYAKSGTVTVTGGEISSLAETAVEPTTDNDGTQGLGYAMIVETGADQGGYADNLSFSVTGGKFTSVGAAVYNFVREGADPIAPGITGGLFKPQPDAELIAVGAEERGEFVEDEDGYYVPVIEEIVYVAQVGEQKFETLQEALNAAAAATDSAKTVVLLDDVTVEEGVSFEMVAKNVSLDLNGKVLTSDITVTAPADSTLVFTVKNAKGDPTTGKIVGDITQTNGKITISRSTSQDVTVEGSLVLDNVADASIQGSVVQADHEKAAITAKGEKTLVKITNVAVVDAAGVAVDAQSGTVKVLSNSSTSSSSIAGTIAKGEDATVTITGGEFTSDPSAMLGADYAAANDGEKWVVTKAVAKIDDKGFATLADAITAAQNDDTVTLLADVTMTEKAEIAQAITIDLNAKTVTFDGCDGFYFTADGVISNGTVTMNAPATDNRFAAIGFEDADGLVKDVTVNAGNAKDGVVCCSAGDYFNEKTVVCENVDVTGAGRNFYAETAAMTLDADCSATQVGEYAGGAVYSDALAAGWLGQLKVDGGEYTAEGNVIATMSSPATITLNDGTFDGAVTITPVDPSYAEMGEHLVTKAEDVELAAPEGYVWSDVDEEGMQKLVVKVSMFYIGETGYDSWDEVASALNDGDVVKIGENAVMGLGNMFKEFTIDLCGNELEWESKGWMGGSLTFIDSDGGGVLTLDVNNRNVSGGTVDLSGLTAEQIAGPGKFWTNASTLIKFPSDMPLETCTSYLANKGGGQKIVVQGVTYIYDSAKDLWVPEGCYFITITEPENGTLETSATNAVPAGTTVTVTATPAEGYQLVSITTNGEAIVGAEFVMPEEDVTVAATFEAVQQSVKITLPVGTPAGYVVSNVTDGVAIDGDTSLPGGAEYELPFGAKIEIWAVPAEGFRVTGENPYVIEEVTSETAVELEDLPSVEEIPYAAQIGDQKYETLQEALNVGGEVVMLADCTEMVVVPAGVEVTLDFNGYKIDVNGWAIKNSGTLTIDDGVVNAREAAITMYGDSVTTINGGTFTSADNAVIMGQGSEVNGNVKLTINGGEFNGGIVTSGYVACGVYAANSGVYAINGGTFNIVNGCGVCARAGQITVGDEAVINVSGEIEGKVGDKATPIPCVALYVDRTEPPYPGYVAETDYLKATSNTLKIDELNQFWAAEADGTYSLHDDSEAVATVNDGYYLTVEGAFAALQAAEAAGVEIIESLCLAEDGIEFQFEGQSVSLAYMELLTVRKDMWLFKHFPFAGHVTLLPGKTIVAKGMADGATIDVPAGYVFNAAEPDPMGYIAYTAVPDVPAWDIVGGEGGINALVKEDGVTKYVEFTSVTLTATGATVGLKAAKIDANGAEFALICKTALTDTETFTLPATLNYEKGELGDATEGLFTVTADLSGYKQLFVVGVGPKTPAN